MENREQLVRDIMKSKWDKMERFLPFMSAYLHDEEILEGYGADDVLRVMSECLSMLFGELNNTLGKLNKYEPKNYTESDFVDMVIESIGETLPELKDRESVLKYVEDFRVILWGHANWHANSFIQSYADIQNKSADVDKLFYILKESMTIVMVECLLRKYERE